MRAPIRTMLRSVASPSQAIITAEWAPSIHEAQLINDNQIFFGKCIIERQKWWRFVNGLSHIGDVVVEHKYATETLSTNQQVAIQLRNILRSKQAQICSAASLQVMQLSPIPPPRPFEGSICFLGTGCASPSKRRCNSAILIQLPQYNIHDSRQSLLIDAGESCCAQLYQSCSGNLDKMHDILTSLVAVWISHHHADHHCGLPMLVSEYKRACALSFLPSRSLTIMAPEDVIRYHEYCLCIAGLDDSVHFESISETPIQSTVSNSVNHKVSHLTRGAILQFANVKVPHCRNSFGLAITLRDGFKIVFSGDCRPSDNLIRIGSNCDVLIHEATFDDSRQSDALSKRHCTTSEAISVGVRMNAKYTILTHFSQRYSNSSPISSSISQNVSVAFDFLRFSFPSQLPYLARCTQRIVEALENNRIEY